MHNYDFSEGLAVVKYKGSYCYIDKKGNIKIKGPFNEANKFKGGIANVVYKGRGEVNIDKNGKIIYKMH